MRTVSTKPALLVLLVLALSVSAFAQPMQGRRGDRNAPRQMSEQLNLSADQETQMQNLRFGNQAVMIDLRAGLQKERLKLRQLQQADKPNQKKIYAQIDKVGAAEVKIAKSRANHQLAVRAILTDEQFQSFGRGMQFGPDRFGGRDGNRDGNCRDRGSKRSFPNRF